MFSTHPLERRGLEKKMLSFKRLLVALLAVAATSTAFAVPTIRITSGTDVVVISDNGLPSVPASTDPDLNAALNVVSYFGTVGTANINFTAGVVTGSPENFIDLGWSSTSNAAGSFVAEFSDTDFTTMPLLDHFLSSIGGTVQAGGTVTFETYVDDGNTLFAQTTALSEFEDMGGPFFGGSEYTGPWDSLVSNPFSLTVVVSVDYSGAFNSSSGNANIEAVPEPSIVALFGMALLAFGLSTRRRRDRV